nr:hypothetical protein [Sunxiuqinia sp.]
MKSTDWSGKWMWNFQTSKVKSKVCNGIILLNPFTKISSFPEDKLYLFLKAYGIKPIPPK